MAEKTYSVCGETVIPPHSLLATQSTPTPASAVGEMYELHDEMPPSGVIYHMDTHTAYTTPVVNWHENVEILFVRSGNGRVLCNSEPMEASASSARTDRPPATRRTATRFRARWLSRGRPSWTA